MSINSHNYDQLKWENKCLINSFSKFHIIHHKSEFSLLRLNIYFVHCLIKIDKYIINLFLKPNLILNEKSYIISLLKNDA